MRAAAAFAVSGLPPRPKETIMTEQHSAPALSHLYDPKVLAKKHRISIDDAVKIIALHGSDRKAIDKAARRVAA